MNTDDTLGNNIDGFQAIIDKYNDDNDPDINLSVFVNNEGKVEFQTDDASNIKFEPISTNFFAETGISDSHLVSKTLNQSVEIQDLLDYNDANGVMVSSTIIDKNGILLVAYNDGSNLTTQINENNQAEWKYTTADGVIISGTDVTPKGSISANSNMIIELATFVNEEGLISLNNNLWEWGADAGQVFYGMAGEMAFGSLETGGYEGSNVDIAVELSNMITAQRLIQMNSRVFGTASSVMETLAYLGQ